jgi:hypothetical protein
MIIQFNILIKKNQNIKCIMTNQLGICPTATTSHARNTKQVIQREILESSDNCIYSGGKSKD